MDRPNKSVAFLSSPDAEEEADHEMDDVKEESEKEVDENENEEDDEPVPVRKRASNRRLDKGKAIVIDSDDEPVVSGGSGEDGKKKLLMVAVEVPSRGSTFSQTVPKATKQLSMDNYFGRSARTTLIVASPKKTASSSKKPSKPPIVKKESTSKSSASKVSQKEKTKKVQRIRKRTTKAVATSGESEDGSQDESDFMPAELASASDDVSADELALESANEEAEESDGPIFVDEKAGKGKSKKLAGALVNIGKVKSEKHKSEPMPCKIKITPREGDLPPIVDVRSMFEDIVDRLPGLKDLFGAKGFRKLRVATMCSGTESPLLALGLVSRILKDKELGRLDVEHVFSCEIEPYKQAYIERNFRPPILFRDVRELGNDFATTAYGAKVRVPGNVDLLVAGTSCVDFSNLNNRKKDLGVKGESTDTFIGMMDWVQRHRPTVIIHENVVGAHWSQMREVYLAHGYSAEFKSNFDTKQYYIPQTRQRGYLCAIDNKASKIPNKWLDAMKLLSRPTTASLESFLLPDDDPRIFQVRTDLIHDPRTGAGKKTARSVDWKFCERRHENERFKWALGAKRPMTQWQEGGRPKVFDFAWQDWAITQVDRVLDLMDILMLKQAKEGMDPSYKTQFWNLSQNVDRSPYSGKADGICPCLTPHMIPFLTNRGGPISGYEALHLQGLPIDELLLTRETSQDLQNLAGNAMSSTVVGSAILSALILAKDELRSPDDDDMELEEEDNVPNRISGEEQLVEKPLDLSRTESLEMVALLEEGGNSSRLCICEGRSGITTNQLNKCTECGFTSCDKCGGRPEHKYIPFTETHKRIAPITFENKIKSVLPMRLRLDGITGDTLEGVKENFKGDLRKGDWEIFKELFLLAVDGEFRFRSLKRQEIWSASYDSPSARLDLLLDPKQPEWRFFAKCPESEGVKSRKRKMCRAPFARMKLDKARNVMDGNWELCLPTEFEFSLKIQSGGQAVDTWQNSLGLEAFDGTQEQDEITVTVPEEVRNMLDRDITGTYKLISDCGTANNSLHKQKDSDVAPLFLFLDPDRTGPVSKDTFVFSITTRRYAFGEERPVVATLDPTYRPSLGTDPKKVKCFVRGQWLKLQGAVLAPPKVALGSEGVFAVPGEEGLKVEVTNENCAAANAILICKVPLPEHAEPVWPRGIWKEVEKIYEKKTFEALAWLTERVRSMHHLSTWNNIEFPQDHTNCERCAPTPPDLKWVFKGIRFVPVEDPQQAGPFERALKSRPTPFTTHLMLDETNTGLLKIGLNISTLVHRALSRLPSEGRTEKPLLSWRLTTDYTPPSKPSLPEFNLTSNKNDKMHSQPPGFKTKLRPEQLRSLTWMLAQEKEDALPFIEEEISEALLSQLGWKGEGKAERAIEVKGGVLADQVGYGKTAITLGLIDCSRKNIPDPPSTKGVIPVKATLIVVPPHLTNQWPSEIVKFTGSNTYKVCVIQSQAHLNKLTIKEIQEAEIIVVASTLFKSAQYLSNLAGFAATNSAPAAEGRRFTSWQKVALADLKEQVDNLRDGGAEFVRGKIDAFGQKVAKGEPEEEFVQKKRLIGQAYVDFAEKKEKAGAKRKRSAGSSEDESELVDDSESGASRAKKSRVTRVDGDPWLLRTNAVQKNWKLMKAPPLEIFHFNRVVVDEYTYLDGQVHAGVTSLKSTFRWVLSGTPPLDDFADVKTIAVFLGIHLGIDDDMTGKTDNRKKVKKDRTAVEAFTAFREVRSPHWHERRHQIAQAFLNQFVRQNIAEIDEIPFVEQIVPITLPAAERAIYLELEHHLQAMDMNIRRSKAKSDNDRDKRLQESLGDSASAEEALLKRCSHFDLDLSKSDEENAVQACDVIVQDRKRQLANCRQEIRLRLRECLALHKKIPASAHVVDDYFKRFVDENSNNIGDPQSQEDIKLLIDEAYGRVKGPTIFQDGAQVKDVPGDYAIANTKDKKGKKPAKGKNKEEDQEDFSDLDVPQEEESIQDKVLQLKARTIAVYNLVKKELAGRHRSLRYFQIVRDLQRFGLKEFAKSNSISDVSCPGCGRNNLPVDEVAVLSSCGHQGCYTCLRKAAGGEQCLIPGCTAAARVLNLVKAESLGTEEKTEGIGRHYGMKLEKVIDLIKNKIEPDDKILLFVQFVDLMEKVSQVLNEYGIEHLQIKGSAAAKSKALEQFQGMGVQAKGARNSGNSTRVLLLNVMDESASGANLTNANHAIFLSPLLTNTDYEYKSCETQAIGRIRRYGQTKTVHVWRFLTQNTMDVEIFEHRTGKKQEDLPHFKM